MADNRSWNLESFLDSLIVELDRAQDTLALKGVTRPLTYTVKDVSLDLQIFPHYTEDGIFFSTAKPGETGASRVSIQLGSISERQIRETTRAPVTNDDVTVDMIDDIDEQTKKNLKKVGVKSASDLERMEKKNIDLTKVTGSKKLDYSTLASAIARARRRGHDPKVRNLSVSQSSRGPVLAVTGTDLMLDRSRDDFPVALINNQPVRILSADAGEMTLSLQEGALKQGPNELTVALDPYSIIRLQVSV